MMTVRKLPYLTLIWDEESRALIAQWKGGFIGRNIKEGLDVGLEEFLKYRPNAQWIGDATEIGMINQDEQDWIDNDWFPRFLKSGVRYMAVVQPWSILARMSVKEIVAKIPDSQLIVYNCLNLEEARAWMKIQAF